MRRLIFVLLLLASHGLVIWAGVKSRESEKAALASPLAPKASDEEKVELSQFMGPEKPESLSEESAAPTWQERYDAALKSIPSDADVAAMVKAGVPDKLAIVSPETSAAFAIWMERDDVAALRWFTDVYGRDGVGFFGEGFRAYLASHPVADLNRLLVTVPDARNVLVDAATSVARDRGIDAVVKLAASLSDSYDRSSVLIFGTSSMDGLGPHLAAIRGCLDGQGMRQFLSNLGNRENSEELRDAVEAAGFSDEALRVFDEVLAKKAEDQRRQSLGMIGLLQEGGLADQNKLAQFEQNLAQAVPDFAGWCKDFADSRLSADEVMARLKDGIPGSEGTDDAMREFLFCKLYPMNPEGALGWLREHHGDWQGMMRRGAISSFCTVEKLQRVADSMSPEDLQASGLEQDLMYRYGKWYQRDPEHCVAAVERLPESHLKKRVRDIMKYHDEQDAKLK